MRIASGENRDADVDAASSLQSPMTTSSLSKRSIALRAPLFLLSALPLIVFLIGASSRLWMDEDGFINLRIVRNLLAGHGPVFNIDERVEASTSTLWLYCLALVGALHVPLEYGAAILGIFLSALGMVCAQMGAMGPKSRNDGSESLVLAIPFGAAIYAVIPPGWDYASSGLETGLVIAWLGASYAALSHVVYDDDVSPAREAWTCVLIGLGPLIRPESTLYCAVFFLAFVFAEVDHRGLQGALVPLLRNALAALAIPVAYQIFRMGYYASAVPNTAIAKEAFLSNWEQGRYYFDNFFVTYWLAWPLGLAVLFAFTRFAMQLSGLSWRTFAVSTFVLGPVAAAAVHVLYLVWIGGDYMHGRLLLPAVFGGLLPVASIPFTLSAPVLLQVVQATLVAAVIPWLPWCGIRLRAGTENVHDIGDERQWYARESHDDHPVRLDDFRPHSFYSEGQRCQSAVDRECSGSKTCRKVFLDDDAKFSADLADSIDPRIHSVCSLGAVGIGGYLLPTDMHVEDRHGLADAIVARFVLQRRGRPGHEKKISEAWFRARFANPLPDDEGDVVAARHALQCGELAVLERAVRGPLTWSTFFDNLLHARELARLRIPKDPFDAEELFCHTPHRPESTTGGDGGDPYRSVCPKEAPLVGLKGTSKNSDQALASVRPICATAQAGEGADSDESGGRLFGEKSDTPFEVTCPEGTVVVGMEGTSNSLVRSVGLQCAAPGGGDVVVTPRGGTESGKEFHLACAAGHHAVGLTGRAGSLIDALGVVCSL